MQAKEALDKAETILKWGKVSSEQVKTLRVDNFLKYSDLVAYVVKSRLNKKQLATPWLQSWALAWRKMRDSFDDIVEADPMVLYRPMNHVSKEFHESKAFIRYFRSGNRTSKTQSGYAEHYFTCTQNHPFRHVPQGPSSTFVIGINFSKYLPNVFQKKFLTGEDDNTLTPMFPHGGKWFNRYDARTHTIVLACPQCAVRGTAGSCKHRKSTITLFSDQEGWEVLQGAQYRLGHFDEHVGEEFFNEALQRTQSVSFSGLVVTGTPLHGFEAWEYRRLAQLAEGDSNNNLMVPGDPTSPQLVSLHQIDQFDAGIVPHDKIRMSMRTMDDFEIESRIYGRPAPLAKNPVFDRQILSELREKSAPPKARGDVALREDTKADVEEFAYASETEFRPLESGPLRIWEYPEEGAQYIAGADTAAGLAPTSKGRAGDASCCSILKILPTDTGKVALRMVAQYHGWINPLDYADELKKLCVYYNRALAVIEVTGGLGRAVMLRMRELNYENIFRDMSKPEYADPTLESRMGVDTNASSKPMMIGALQQLIKARKLQIPCASTIQEMVAFEQERTTSGLTTRYRGAKGAYDDRVMSLVIGCYVAIAFPIYDFMKELNDGMVMDIDGDDEWMSPDKEIWKDVHDEVKNLDAADPFA